MSFLLYEIEKKTYWLKLWVLEVYQSHRVKFVLCVVIITITNPGKCLKWNNFEVTELKHSPSGFQVLYRWMRSRCKSYTNIKTTFSKCHTNVSKTWFSIECNECIAIPQHNQCYLDKQLCGMEDMQNHKERKRHCWTEQTCYASEVCSGFSSICHLFVVFDIFWFLVSCM